MGDVGNRIIDLAFVERPPAPVSEPGALVEAVTEHRFDEVGIADLLAVTERHRRDLRVEQRRRDLAGQIVDDFQVLAAGVEDLEHVVILHQQVEQRPHVEVGLGVDRRRLFRACDLDQAQLGPIGVLAHELGVHGDERVLGEALDQLCERRAFGD